MKRLVAYLDDILDNRTKISDAKTTAVAIHKYFQSKNFTVYHEESDKKIVDKFVSSDSQITLVHTPEIPSLVAGPDVKPQLKYMRIRQEWELDCPDSIADSLIKELKELYTLAGFRIDE